MNKIMLYLKNSYNYRFLLLQLITKSIKLKYRKSYLGVLWSLIEPLLTMIVLSFVFTKLLERGDRYFPVYILSGRLLYSFFSTGTKAAMRSVRTNSAIIKKVYVPKYMYPLSACISTFIISLISLIDLALVMIVLQQPVNFYVFAAIIPILILFFFTYGIGLLLSVVDVFFRDIEYIWEVLSMLIMYTCAIFYKVDSFLGTPSFLVFQLNPVYVLIKCFRDCMNGVPMNFVWLGYALICSILACVFGALIFNRKQNEFIFHI